MKTKYYLRNKMKIRDYYSSEILQRIIKSLDFYFRDKTRVADVFSQDHEHYPMFIISDVGHTVNDIVFYIVSFKEGENYTLAFKEFIG